jgi:hypothetical protein
MDEQIIIVGLEANPAVGRGTWTRAAVVRAGVAGFAQHPYMIDTASEPIRVATAPWIDIGRRGADCFEELLCLAIDEELSVLGDLGDVSAAGSLHRILARAATLLVCTSVAIERD